MLKLKSNYFCGKKISDYGIEKGYLDYQTFANAFNHVLANETFEKLSKIEYWELLSGGIDNSEKMEELEEKMIILEKKIEDESISEEERTAAEAEHEELEGYFQELEVEDKMLPEVYQWFIVDSDGIDLCQEAGEVVVYFEKYDLAFWGVSHWGTSWDYVLTDIKIERDSDDD